METVYTRTPILLNAIVLTSESMTLLDGNIDQILGNNSARMADVQLVIDYFPEQVHERDAVSLLHVWLLPLGYQQAAWSWRLSPDGSCAGWMDPLVLGRLQKPHRSTVQHTFSTVQCSTHSVQCSTHPAQCSTHSAQCSSCASPFKAACASCSACGLAILSCRV